MNFQSYVPVLVNSLLCIFLNFWQSVKCSGVSILGFFGCFFSLSVPFPVFVNTVLRVGGKQHCLQSSVLWAPLL